MNRPVRPINFVLGLGLIAIAYAPLRANATEGRTLGSFAVSQTGAGTYTIPIWAPPGPRGVQPRIALTYNSRSGNVTGNEAASFS